MERIVTLPTREQIENSNILNHTKKGANFTDFCVMEYASSQVKGVRGYYFTKTEDPYYGSVCVVNSNGLIETITSFTPLGVRPVISLGKEEVSKETLTYGEYPQTIVNENLEKELENLYQRNKLIETENNYTSMLNEEHKKFPVYVHNNDKYIRVDNNTVWYNDKDNLFSDRRFAGSGAHWVKVEPIEWLVDKNAGIAISEKILTIMPFSYNDTSNYEKSDIKEFLEKVFIKEIQVNKTKENKNIDIEKINDLINLMGSLSDANGKKLKVKVKK